MRHFITALVSVFVVVAMLPGVAVAEAPAPELRSQSPTVTVQPQAAGAGWVKTAAGKRYYKHGRALTGLQKIKGTYYYFSSKGILKTKDFKAGGTTYYVASSGAVIGAKHKSRYYYRTLKRMTSTDAYNFVTYLKARAVIAKVCAKKDSRVTKRYKLFNWTSSQNYTHRFWYETGANRANWISYHARKMLGGKGGDCHGSSAAYAYLLKALGYSSSYCVNGLGADDHAWVESSGRRFDPTFAKWQGPTNYYNVTGRGYYDESRTWVTFTLRGRYAIPWFSPSNAPKGSKVPTSLLRSGKAGLKKEGGSIYYYVNGAKLKNAWRTVDGKRYYFKKNGKAATSSTKIKGSYYLFNKKGVLQRGSSSNGWLVSLGSDIYRVDGSGKAMPGWSADGTRRFSATGLLLKGVHRVSGQLYAADGGGAYLPGLTAQLNEAGKPGSRATALRRLLGKPVKQVYSKSCNFAGDDGVWEYANIYVFTARPTAVKASYPTIEAAIAAEDAGVISSTFESIVSVEAK